MAQVIDSTDLDLLLKKCKDNFIENENTEQKILLAYVIAIISYVKNKNKNNGTSN